jgi:hypothetical protein
MLVRTRTGLQMQAHVHCYVVPFCLRPQPAFPFYLDSGFPISLPYLDPAHYFDVAGRAEVLRT